MRGPMRTARAAVRSLVLAAIVLSSAEPLASTARAGEGAVDPLVMARAFPERTLAALMAEDLTQTFADTPETSAGKLWADPEFKAFIDPIIEKLTEAPEDEQDALGTLLADLEAVASGRVALALVGLKMCEGFPTPLPELALVAEVSDRAKVMSFIDRARTEFGKAGTQTHAWNVGPLTFGRIKMKEVPVQVSYVLSDRVLCAALDLDGRLIEEVAAAATGRSLKKSLADDPELLVALERAGARCDLFFFLETRRLAQNIFDLAARGDAAQRPAAGPGAEDLVSEWAKQAHGAIGAVAKRMYVALGLDGVRSISFSCSVDAPGVRSQLFVHAPSPRRGLLSLVSEEPIRESMLRLAPEGARSFVAWKWRPEKLQPVVKDVLAAIDPGKARGREGRFAGVETYVSTAANVASEGTLFFARANVEPIVEVANVVVATRVADTDALRPMYEMLVAKAAAAAAEQGLAVKDMPTPGGDTVEYVSLPLGFSPAVALSPQHFVIAPTRDAVADTLRLLRKPGGKSLAGSDDCKAALGHVDAASTFYLSYSRRARAEDYAPWLALAPIASAALYAASFQVDTPPDIREVLGAINIPKMPSPGLLAKYSIPSIAVGWADSEGIGLTGWGESPFGFSGAAVSSMTTVAGAAIVAAIVIPSVTESRAE